MICRTIPFRVAGFNKGILYAVSALLPFLLCYYFMIGMAGSILLFIPTILINDDHISFTRLFSDTDNIRNTFRGIWETLKKRTYFYFDGYFDHCFIKSSDLVRFAIMY